MLNQHQLPSLQDRRKQLRLSFFYKVVEGLVPALPPDNFLTPVRSNKRPIRAPVLKDFVTTNPVARHQTLNSRAFKVPPTKTDQHKNSFFTRTTVDWNLLPESTVRATTIEAFKQQINTA